MLRGWLFARAQKPPTHLGPAYWNSYRTDLAKLLIFYKDLNQRSIMENPANSVSGSLLRLSRVCDFAHLPGLREQSQTVGVQPKLLEPPKANQASDQNGQGRRGQTACSCLPQTCSGPGLTSGSLGPQGLCVKPAWWGFPLDRVLWPSLQIEQLLSNIGGQLGLWMSCSVVCIIEIIEVFFIDSLSIIARHQWHKAKRWWARRRAPACPEAPRAPQGRDNPSLDIDDDLPTFTSALSLPPAPGSQVPGTPPPRYTTLRLERAFSSQLSDTQVPAES